MTLDLVKYVIKNKDSKVLSKSNTWVDPLEDPEYVFYYSDYLEAESDLEMVQKVFSEETKPEIRSVLIGYDYDWIH